MKTNVCSQHFFVPAVLAVLVSVSTFHPRPACSQGLVVDSFDPEPYVGVNSLAIQPDGKILIGGPFTNVCGQPSYVVARLNADGTLDPGFNSGASAASDSEALVIQPDGKIIVGGTFSLLGGRPGTNIARLNADGSLDLGFNPGASRRVNCVALQTNGMVLVEGWFDQLGGQPCSGLGRLTIGGQFDPGFNVTGNNASGAYTLLLQADGKILVGGSSLLTLGGQSLHGVGRLKPDGTLDSSFNAALYSMANVFALAVQPDGKILVGGQMLVAAAPPPAVARLNVDGTLDSTFKLVVNTSADVNSLALQADGKVLVAETYGVQRLNPDGTLDSTLSVQVDGTVWSLAIQADGKIIAGGQFGLLNGQPRGCIGRLYNTGRATQSLGYNGSTITWLRGGTSPEVWRTTFEVSTNGSDWSLLGAGTRITGGWQLASVAVPKGGTIRSRGYVAGFYRNGSAWFVETLLSTRPQIILNDGQFGFGANGFGFDVGGIPAQAVVVECSSDLCNWAPIRTNTLSSATWYFTDAAAGTTAPRFYRVRCQ